MNKVAMFVSLISLFTIGDIGNPILWIGTVAIGVLYFYSEV